MTKAKPHKGSTVFHDSSSTRRTPRGDLRYHESMARHVSWRAGGVVERAYFPVGISDLREFLRAMPVEEPLYFVGLGSNLLVRDGGLRGTVVFTHHALQQIRLAGNGAIYAEAGVATPKVARFAALHDLAGAEFLAGIPGTVGGALAMNAGCYGRETWDAVIKVKTIDRTGRINERMPEQYAIGYRTVLRRPAPGTRAVGKREQTEEWFIAATFCLGSGNSEVSRRKIKELLTQRIATQPLGFPNAGSVFRNPPGRYAAQLIEECGLKGHVIGGAAISQKHANFIVNGGNACAADIESLIDLAEIEVKKRFGIQLEREVRIIGEPK